jgi:exodeoxyribonuclease X
MKIRVIDFETTGVPPDAAICQIGQCDVTINDGKVTVGMPSAMFVNPGRPIPPEARAVHHIRDRDVEHAPSVDRGLIQLMDGPPDVFCAHNAKFEREFYTGGNVPWICTRKVGMRLWPDAPNFQNQTLRYFLGIDGGYDFQAELAMPPHRAGPDCYITAHLVARALTAQPIEQLIEWSNQPSLLPGAINFGKHKGVLWSQCDSSYLEWMTRQPDMDEDKVFTARHWLNRRRSDAR